MKKHRNTEKNLWTPFREIENLLSLVIPKPRLHLKVILFGQHLLFSLLFRFYIFGKQTAATWWAEVIPGSCTQVPITASSINSPSPTAFAWVRSAAAQTFRQHLRRAQQAEGETGETYVRDENRFSWWEWRGWAGGYVSEQCVWNGEKTWDMKS